MKLSAALPLVLVALAASGAHAQGRSTPPEKERDKEIPAAARPPAGMCRVWLDDVPAAQQPAPTDCATAVKNRPAKGRVIFGDDYVKKGRQPDTSKGVVKSPPIRTFAPPVKRP
jgi:hypothetical protein